MWTAKIKFDSKKTLIGSRAKKYNLDLYGFPVFSVSHGEWLHVNIIGNIAGDTSNIKKFIKELKEQDRVINVELNDSFMIATIKEPSFMRCLYNENIIHVSPALISRQGYELIHISSFKREYIQEVVKIFKPYKGEILSIRQEKIKSISVMKAGKDLTKKQEDAINLAISQGYYHIPRKISVEELAKISKLSFSTYQVHLRKAESKIIPQILE